MRLAFVWQGMSGRYGHWQDGLYAAMKLIEEHHDVRYYDTDQLDQLKDFSPDVVLYWEAPVTILGKDAANWNAVCELPYKKYLLFAGGRIEPQWLDPFELVFVESRINEEELTRMGKPWKRAFGVNTNIMKPIDEPKLYDGFMQATFAAWKRHELFAKALGERGAVAGRVQEHDRHGYNECINRGVDVFPEMSAESVAALINRSYAVVNTSEYWGGGQRCTLEAMACGVPVIVMSDSPKNSEYVEESGAGLIVDPDPAQIRDAIDQVKNWTPQQQSGLEYIQSKWTERHYANAILDAIT